MFEMYAGLYLGIGLIVAGFVFALFPPVPGYKPSLSLVITAATVYIFLWPFLVLLGLGYLVGQVYCRLFEGDKKVLKRSTPRRQLSVSYLYDEAQIRN